MTRLSGSASLGHSRAGGGGRLTIVFGTGSAAALLIERHGSKLGHLYFANTTGAGEFQGQPVIAITEIAALSDSAEIIVASSFVRPILVVLDELGVSRERVWWYRAERDCFVPGAAVQVLPAPTDILNAFYDLACHDSLHDAAVFAARAEAARRRRRLRAINFLIVPGADVMLRDRLGEPSGMAEAVFRLVPSAAGCARLACREDAETIAQAGARFPAGYDIAAPRGEATLRLVRDDLRDGFDPRILAAPVPARELVARQVRQYLGDRRLVTFSLREFPGEPERGGSLAGWSEVLARFPAERYHIVVLRAPDCAYDQLPEALSSYADFPQASADPAFRLALYELADLNLMDNQDSAALLIFSAKCRYRICRAYLPLGWLADKDPLTNRYGLAPGAALPFAGPDQHLIWHAPDTTALPDNAVPNGEPMPIVARSDGMAGWFPADDGSLGYALAQEIYTRSADVPLDPARLGLAWQDMLDDPDCGVFLCLGQSNAGNHGDTLYQPCHAVYSLSFGDLRCTKANDPLSGASGFGGSIWSRLGDRLVEAGLFSRVLFLPVAMGGSFIVDWLPGGSCHRRLALLLSRLRRTTGLPALPINAGFWTQGEAEANCTRMPADLYRLYFTELLASLREVGVGCPFFVAQTTHCATAAHEFQNHQAIRTAQERLIATEPGILAGPDLDQLDGSLRYDGCHFSGAGLDRAAALWLEALRAANDLIRHK